MLSGLLYRCSVGLDGCRQIHSFYLPTEAPSLEHTNRTLQALRETGAVEWRSGRLTVKDLPKLREIARFDPHYLHLRSDAEG